MFAGTIAFSTSASFAEDKSPLSSPTHVAAPTIKCNGASIQGRRPYNEDRVVMVEHYNHNPNEFFFGVYDGHGGSGAASFSASNLHRVLASLPEFKTDPAEALRRAFLAVDQQFCSVAGGANGDESGTTACVAFVRDSTLWVANAGDSRAVLFRRQNTSIPLSFDHKPDHPAEKQRIEKLGGFIAYYGVWRVQGMLAVSRAIGDLSLKPYVVALPDVIQHTIGQNDEFLLLATDGLWDVMNNEQAGEIIRKSNTLQQAATNLVNVAYKRGSVDNISCVIADLRGHSIPVKNVQNPGK